MLSFRPNYRRLAVIDFGRVTERLNVPVLKTGDGKPSVGSNPTPSASFVSLCGSLIYESMKRSLKSF